MFEQRARNAMGGVGRPELLEGDIGLLRIEPALFSAHLTGDDITAAMHLLRHTRALVVDLRGCRGGDPAAVAYFCTCLLPPGTHVNDVHDRTEDRTGTGWEGTGVEPDIATTAAGALATAHAAALERTAADDPSPAGAVH